MNFFIRLALILPFLLAAGALAPAAHAQTPCTGPDDTSCPAGTTCRQDLPGDGFYKCLSGSTGLQPSGGGSTGLQPSSGGSTGLQPSGTGLANPLKSSGDLPAFLKNILGFVVNIGFIVVVLMLVYVGFLFVTARGKPEELTKARSALMWTVVGALILLGAEAIAQGIQATINTL